MSEKTQECCADQVSPRAEITSQDLLRELMKAEIRHLRVRNLLDEEKLIAEARANERIEKAAAAASAGESGCQRFGERPDLAQGNLSQGQAFSRDAETSKIACRPADFPCFHNFLPIFSVGNVR